MYGVEEAPVKGGERHGHVPCVHAQEPHWTLAQLRTLRQGGLAEEEEEESRELGKRDMCRRSA